jgi:hypothetical protein
LTPAGARRVGSITDLLLPQPDPPIGPPGTRLAFLPAKRKEVPMENA